MPNFGTPAWVQTTMPLPWQAHSALEDASLVQFAQALRAEDSISGDDGSQPTA
jgi:hypothetical protein